VATLKVGSFSLSKPLLSLIIALAGFTFAGIVIRLTQQNGVPSIVIASLRLILASAILTPFVIKSYRPEIARLTRKDWLFSVFAGVWIGIHFILVITSVEKTSIMLNQVITNTGPIWVALMEVFFLKVHFGRNVWWGLLIALLGGILIALSHGSDGSAQADDILLGNFLALLGSLAGSVYIISGRVIRQKVSLIPYLWILYGVGGFVTTAIVIISGYTFFGYTLEGYFWVLMVTLIPTLIGHSSFNYALAYMPATLVTLSGQIVTVTATILAFIVFLEAPTFLEVLAGAIIMTGVFIANKREPKSLA